MKRPGFIVTIAVLMGAASAQQLPTGSAKDGKELFVKYTCYGCHGFSGQNGPGMKLVPMTMTQADFTGRVREPGNPRQMPSYSPKVITDQQLADIWAYIKTLPNAPAAKDIPLIQEIKGENK